MTREQIQHEGDRPLPCAAQEAFRCRPDALRDDEKTILSAIALQKGEAEAGEIFRESPEHLRDYTILKGVNSYAALGRYYLANETAVPEELYEYMDLDALGCRYEDEHPGVFIGSDYVCYGIATRMGELVFFAIKPTNISVLPDTGVGARIYALLNVVKGMAEIEMLALNSKESFENNKAFYRQRANEEELPVIRKLLEQDSKHLDRIQVLMASSREFYILVRLQGKKESDVFSYLSRIEKSIKDNGFTVRRATEEDLKRMLGVYFEQNVTTERYEDHDGERWVLFGE